MITQGVGRPMFSSEDSRKYSGFCVCLFCFVLFLLCQFQCVSIAQACPTLCNPMDCSPPCSSAHRILQARILEWVAISFSRGSFQHRDHTRVSCITGRFFMVWDTREALTASKIVHISGTHILHLQINDSGATSACCLYSGSLTTAGDSYQLLMEYVIKLGTLGYFKLNYHLRVYTLNYNCIISLPCKVIFLKILEIMYKHLWKSFSLHTHLLYIHMYCL